MIKCDYQKEDLLKAMLLIAQRKRPLTKLEQKYDKESLSISDSRLEKIQSLLASKGCVEQQAVFFDRPDPSTIIMPMITSEGGGLTETGEDELRELIKSFEEEIKSKRKAALKNSLKWVMGIVAAVIAGIIMYRLGVK